MQGTYLMALPVPTYPLGGGRFAAESAFCEELRAVQPRLRKWFSHTVIATTEMSREEYELRRSSLSVMSPAEDGVEAVQLFPAGVGKATFLSRWLVPTLRILRREVQRAGLVHAGPSHDLWRPFAMLALTLGVLARRPTLSVTDMDLRNDARMAYATSRISRFEYLKNRLAYDPLRALEHELVVRMCSLVLFKGQALVDDFGRGRRHVKNIFDPAFPPELVATDAILEAKIQQMLDRSEPLKLLYFGRYSEYKGVQVMLDALASVQAQEPDAVVLHLMGAGEQEAELRARVEREGLADCVSFGEPVPYGPEFFENLYPHHLMLATPLGEDSPRSSWDALAAGVPVLAFDTYHYRSLQPTGGVDLVPWPSTEAVAERILHFAHDREALAKMARAGVRAARANTQQHWLDQRLGWIASLVEEPSVGTTG